MQIDTPFSGRGAYTPGQMEWATVRKRFVATRKHLGLTQEQVAERGDIGQSRISQMESDPDYSPSFDTFTAAVKGLGLTLSEFFAHIERHQENPLPPSRQSATTTPSRHESNPQEGVDGAPLSSSGGGGLPDILERIGRMYLSEADRERSRQARVLSARKPKRRGNG